MAAVSSGSSSSTAASAESLTTERVSSLVCFGAQSRSSERTSTGTERLRKALPPRPLPRHLHQGPHVPQAATSKAASKDLISEALPKALPGFQAGGALAPTRPARASKSPKRRVWYTYVWSICSPGRPGRARRVGSGNGSPKLTHPAASAPQSA